MSIIAWDKINDVAIEPQRAPNNGEWAKFDKGNGKFIKRVYWEVAEPPITPVKSITNIDFSGAGVDPDQGSPNRKDFLTGQNITITFNVDIPDGEKLTIPVKNKDTGELKVIKAKVNAGAVSKSFKFDKSGFYYINSELVNSVGREDIDFQLDSIDILVQDD